MYVWRDGVIAYHMCDNCAKRETCEDYDGEPGAYCVEWEPDQRKLRQITAHREAEAA